MFKVFGNIIIQICSNTSWIRSKQSEIFLKLFKQGKAAFFVQIVRPKFEKFIFFKDGFLAEGDNYISFPFACEASRHLNDMFKVSKSMYGFTKIQVEYFWNNQRSSWRFLSKEKPQGSCQAQNRPMFQRNNFFRIWLEIYWTKVAFPCSRKFRKDLWLFQKYFQVYLGRSRNTFRYLEHVT